MDVTEKTQIVRNLIDDVSVSDDQIATYLAIAADRIINRLYPFSGSPGQLSDVYDMIQCELAVRMIARRGGEGEISHNENGISRSYGSVDDEDILSRLTPYVGVIS